MSVGFLWRETDLARSVPTETEKQETQVQTRCHNRGQTQGPYREVENRERVKGDTQTQTCPRESGPSVLTLLRYLAQVRSFISLLPPQRVSTKRTQGHPYFCPESAPVASDLVAPTDAVFVLTPLPSVQWRVIVQGYRGPRIPTPVCCVYLGSPHWILRLIFHITPHMIGFLRDTERNQEHQKAKT